MDKTPDFYCADCIFIEWLPVSGRPLPQFVCREAGGVDILMLKAIVPKAVTVSPQEKADLLVFRSNRCMEKRLKKTIEEAANDTGRTNQND